MGRAPEPNERVVGGPDGRPFIDVDVGPRGRREQPDRSIGSFFAVWQMEAKDVAFLAACGSVR